MVVLLLVLGLAARLLPLASSERTIATISEDGYLMLTVARNLSRGDGMSTAGGTILTNGVQPLVTVLWAGLHWITGAERLATLRLVLVVQLTIALLAAGAIWLLARRVFADHPWRDVLALATAALWFASPLSITHTTNGLETGPYLLAIIAFLLLDLQWKSDGWRRATSMGAVLGILFLMRNDAVFLIVAVVAAEPWRNVSPLRPVSARVTSAFLIGGTSVIVALPWLFYSATTFGHIVPVSGRAQNLNATMGENLFALPRVLLEYVIVVAPLPVWLNEGAWPLVSVLAFVAAVGAAIGLRDSLRMQFGRPLALLAIFVALLAIYYGFFFGAAYFLSRYLFPFSVLTVLLLCAGLAAVARLRPVLAMGLVAVAVAILMVSLQRQYARGTRHPHAQVVEWVSANVSEDTWIGAPQSGFLGYFHDRTINLDGKLNPQAFAARRDERLFRYIVDETPIEYIVDWYGLARWVDQPDTVTEERDPAVLMGHFDVLVRDRERNLVVLKRTPKRPDGAVNRQASVPRRGSRWS